MIESTRQAMLFNTFPLVRSHNVIEAQDRISRVFSPHSLKLRQPDEQLNVIHNQVRLREVSLNVLSYGAEVTIQSGERGDFYLMQLPLSGSARISCGGQCADVDTEVLSILQPHAKSHMIWSSACSMILVQVPRCVMQTRAQSTGAKLPQLALAYSRTQPEIAAWWQAALDLARTLDGFGTTWLRYPAACTSMEEFLLSAFQVLLCDDEQPEKRFPERGAERSLRRAKEYIHAHLDRALSSPEIARHACVSPRTLEALFKRFGEVTPLAYARRCRLHAVHDTLRQARQEGRTLNVTEVALSYGFLHMGRFAAQYKQLFGYTPSETMRTTSNRNAP
jgi:AraC-like DNA-binding protein